MTTAYAKLLDAVRRSNLVQPESLDALCDELSSAGECDGDTLIEALSQRALLSAYQVDSLRAGRLETCILTGRYQLVELLGTGGMGQVFRARDIHLGRDVAVKVLPTNREYDDVSIARFHREAKALAHLSHPAIVQAYDADQDGDRQFLVMELADGTDLASALRGKPTVSPGEAANYVYQAALGMQHAHEKGLVHRDLKPGNLLLDSSGNVKILDLGLARFMHDQIGDATVTRQGSGLGTPDYMAPEQFHDARHVDARSDIYSLGCTLFHFITGRVPFPGTSLSEKVTSHESRDPPPLDELTPAAPTGLVLVVRRMMAKRPEDRFQSMREVAEALAPFVPASSPSSRDIQATSTWHGSQLEIRVRPRRASYRKPVPIALTAVAAIVVAVFTYALWPNGSADRSIEPNGGSGKVSQVDYSQRQVLTVSKDGDADFTSINAALRHARPRLTIRVLDDATYDESVSITGSSRFEGLTLEATGDAKLAVSNVGISIKDVAGVAVRGFSFLGSDEAKPTGIIISGVVPDTLIEDCAFRSDDQAQQYDGITVIQAASVARHRPVVIRACNFAWTKNAISIASAENVLIHDCLITEPSTLGILIIQESRRIHVVGNRFVRGSAFAGIQFESMSDKSSDILVANNTFFECSPSIRIWDDDVKGERIEWANNMALASTSSDFVFIDSGGDPRNPRGPGDGKLVLARWNVHHNAREIEPPTGQSMTELGWIPESESDTITSRFEAIPRDPAEPDFLRPAADSELASSRGNAADSALPAYAGAIPPGDVEPWDWEVTWRHRFPQTLFTVSQNPESGGEFRTIGDALDAAGPNATIRVLDDATYSQSLSIAGDKRYHGLTLEASGQATWQLPAGASQALALDAVTGVRITGFRFVAQNRLQLGAMLRMRAGCAGTQITGVTFECDNVLNGIEIVECNGSLENPIVIDGCTLIGGADGIAVVATSNFNERTAGGIRITNNHLRDMMRGIHIQQRIHDVLVAANTLNRCRHVAIQIQEPVALCQRIVIANNSALDNMNDLRIWDTEPFESITPGQVAVLNNVMFNEKLADAVLAHESEGEANLVDGSDLIQTWRFANNWRYSGGRDADRALPLGEHDRPLESDPFLSRQVDSPDFMVPMPGSPIVKVPGDVAPSLLPDYAGAVPPDGAEAWDWQLAWEKLDTLVDRSD